MKKKSTQIIYLNGPSSSGKSTLARSLQSAFDIPFLCIGIDNIIQWMPEKLNDWTGGYAPLGYSFKKSVDDFGHPIQEIHAGPYAKRIPHIFREVVLALARLGEHVVVDDVSFGKKEVDEWKKALKNYRVLWVGVNAPLAILEQREKERGDRIFGSARAQFHKVHVGTEYDILVDTYHENNDEIVDKITSLIVP